MSSVSTNKVEVPNNGTITDRLKYVMEVNDFNPNSFAQSVGASRTVFYEIFSGKSKNPSGELLAKVISSISDINADWLLTGRGEPFVKAGKVPEVSNEVSEPVASFGNPVAPEGKEFHGYITKIVDGVETKEPIFLVKRKEFPRLKMLAKRGLLNPPENKEVASYKSISDLSVSPTPNIIPLNVSAAAGGGYIIDTQSQVAGKAFAMPGITGSAERYAIKVVGDSMTPTLYSQDVIIIERLHSFDLTKGKIYAIAGKDNLAYVKRLVDINQDSLILSSDNKSHEGLIMPLADIQQCFLVLARYTTNLNLANGNSDDLSHRVAEIEQRLSIAGL